MDVRNPILVEVTRGPLVESFHRGAYALVDAQGRVIRAVGDIDRPIYPRSALKPLQALALIESGAAEAFGVSGEEIALACGSHSGQDIHVEKVGAWLKRLGLSADDLECGASEPVDAGAKKALVRRGEAPTALHHNCSGKHAGFLTVARHLKVPTRNYIDPEHPVQQLVLQHITTMTGAIPHSPCGCDGCGVPTWAMPLSALALGMARLADKPSIITAMQTHPFLVAGRGRFDTDVMTAHPNLVVKGGAEGVLCALIPEQGLGLAIKVDDGGLRAASVIGAALLSAYAPLSAEKCAPPVLNNQGAPVGVLRAVLPS
ncbi:MAG: hypothetical protein A2516_03960 [Alphaproteobacteria bacterium RIFOXYD12_FULL_60_8]|nr:MAG: hypothetical protein A2516_03960 [Alphaproteobacteria bacterium RIFOXYD12_FULL_60_8]